MTAPVVVVVDSDPTFCRLLQEMLPEEGYQAVICASAAEAPITIQLQRPDLVILDVHVERRGAGLLLLAQLRQDPATASIPVLVCTADGALLRGEAERLRAPGLRVLAKPFDLDDLLTQVRALLDATLPPTSTPSVVNC